MIITEQRRHVQTVAAGMDRDVDAASVVTADVFNLEVPIFSDSESSTASSGSADAAMAAAEASLAAALADVRHDLDVAALVKLVRSPACGTK